MAGFAKLESVNGLVLTDEKTPQKEKFADLAISVACQIAFLDYALNVNTTLVNDENPHSEDKLTIGKSVLKAKLILSSFKDLLLALPQKRSWTGKTDNPYKGCV